MDLASQLSNKMDDIISLFNARMGEFERTMGVQPTNPTVKLLASDFVNFKSFILTAVGMLKDQIQLLALGFDRQETQSRRKVLLFQGLAEAKDEDVKGKVQTLLTSQMKLPGISPSSIEACHRLGEKKDKTRPVLVRFSSFCTRAAVWNAKTKLKGSKVSVKEFLTKPRQEVFAATRAHFGIKKCWSADGTIVVLTPDNKRVKLVSMAEFNELQKIHPVAVK